jgi:hypothetical protein
MKKLTLLVTLLITGWTTAPGQALTDILVDVDTLFLPGAIPGHLAPLDPEVTPLVSSSPCELPQLHYAVVRSYQAGKVMAIAHEGLLADGNIDAYDNRQFVANAIDWLTTDGQRVALRAGWIHGGNSGVLQSDLAAAGYSFSMLNGDINSTALAAVDILILGNDWNGVAPYPAAAVAALEAFVAEGGSLLIAGLGWSWPQALATYPMNQVAQTLGMAFTPDFLNDANYNVNGSPKLYTFYPENVATGSSPYCPAPFVGTNLARGETLRVLRLAVSTNGEFTQQNGGVEAVATQLDEWLDQINATYGREYCVRFELIPGNDQLIFPEPATDPWGTLPAGSGGCTNAGIILNAQASVIDGIIGAANYDLSHVIVGSPFGGGCAAGLKAAVSGGLDIPVTRHELGHQFAQAHTINHSNNNNYEPENGGWTIQGGNAQGYAHAVSFHQLADFLANRIPARGVQVPTGNTIPTVSAGPDYVIPISTPFTLTGTANDPDAGDSLTYVWDNLNRGIAQHIPLEDDSQGAWFMRLLPDTSASRTFPRMSDVVANNNANAQEQLPTRPRILDLRLTVNDNHRILYEGQTVNASGTHSDDVQLVVADAGPLVVTSQNTAGIAYPGGSQQVVTWDVNGTDGPPVNTQQVSISLSTDGGFTYPDVLLPSTANDGSATVTLPNIATDRARIRVAAVDNIYFDINTADFTLQLNTAAAAQRPDAMAVRIYPNPTSDRLTIDWSGFSGRPFTLVIHNELGQAVWSRRIDARPDQSVSLDCSASPFTAGVYLLRIAAAEGPGVVRRFVVVR